MRNKNLLAYHGLTALKETTMKTVEAHRLADTLQQGLTGQDGKGCAVWCTVGAYRHSDYETKLGIPVELALLEDRIFERLSVEDSKLWPCRFLGAIQPGADLSLVFPQFYHWVWMNPDTGIIRFVKDAEAKETLTECLELFARWGRGDKPSETEWSEAISKTRARARARALALARARALDLDLARARARARARALDLDLDLDLDLARALDLDLDLALARARALDRALDLDLDLALALDLDLALALALALDLSAREKIYAANAARLVELLEAAPVQAVSDVV